MNGERREKERESSVCCRHANSCWTATWIGLVGSSDLTARNLVSDTINIGPGELSQSRGSLSAASVNPVDLKYPLCGFFSLTQFRSGLLFISGDSSVGKSDNHAFSTFSRLLVYF